MDFKWYFVSTVCLICITSLYNRRDHTTTPSTFYVIESKIQLNYNNVFLITTYFDSEGNYYHFFIFVVLSRFRKILFP